MLFPLILILGEIEKSKTNFHNNLGVYSRLIKISQCLFIISQKLAKKRFYGKDF